MEHTYRPIIVGVLMFIAVGITVVETPTSLPPAAAGQAGRETVETAPPLVIGATRLEDEMVRWAQRRFATAGLELPHVQVIFHHDLASCGGFLGYYSAANGRIDICNRGGRRTAPLNTVLHELGHAWSFANMTDGEIATFVAHRELDVWHGEATPWWKMGKEQAAEIVAWGLQGPTEYESIWLQLEACSDLGASFELVTGNPPLHTNTTHCK